jgi:hypothetical protein
VNGAEIARSLALCLRACGESERQGKVNWSACEGSERQGKVNWKGTRDAPCLRACEESERQGKVNWKGIRDRRLDRRLERE